MRYFLEFSYKGTAYNGWQVQDNASSVQQELQRALSVILRCDTAVTGAGRTDTGVHALYYVAHFDTDTAIAEPAGFVYHLNALLPCDIAVKGVRLVQDNAHARFDAIMREYTYIIIPRKDAFRRDTSWQYYVNLDVGAMNEAAQFLLEYDDFTSFAKLNSANKTNICKVRHARWEALESGELRFTIRADRFLRNMVRAIVGTLVEVGRGKRTADSVRLLIEARDLSQCTGAAPAQGLFLSDIVYPGHIFIP